MGVVLWSLRSEAASSISVPNLKRIAQFFTKLCFQDFEIRSRDPGQAHLGVVLWPVRMRVPSTKIGYDTSVRLIKIESIRAGICCEKTSQEETNKQTNEHIGQFIHKL